MGQFGIDIKFVIGRFVSSLSVSLKFVIFLCVVLYTNVLLVLKISLIPFVDYF